MEKTFKALQCQSVENISRINENNGTPTTKAPDIFGSCVNISIFQTSFTKSKSYTNV